MAEAEGFTPATDASPKSNECWTSSSINKESSPLLGSQGSSPRDCFRLDPESPFQRWQREADEYGPQGLHVEEIEAALNLARKYGVDDLTRCPREALRP